MQSTPLAGADLAASLSAFFPETVDILESSPVEDTDGYEEAVWTVATGLSGLAAAVGSDSLSINQLQSGGVMVREVTALKFKLASSHPEITVANRLRWNGEDWRIVSVFPDMAATFTHLSCELVVPGV